MRNAKKLKGTNIFLNDDLCAASQAIKNSQMPALKEARAQGKIAFFRHTKLIIRERIAEDGTARRGQLLVHAAAKAGSGSSSGAGGDAAGPGAASGTSAGVIAPEASGAGDVVPVEVHGAWTGGREEANPSRSSPRLIGSLGHPSFTPKASKQYIPIKKQ